MKFIKIIQIIILLIFYSKVCNAQTCDVKKGQEEFIKKIIDIRDYLEKEKSIDIVSYINDLEKLTNIESESDMNFFGKMNPTKNDLIKWNKWYENKKEIICWDYTNNRLFIKL
ncbi:hypothetical protein ACTS9U_11640 [Empedobacter falsenii]